MRLHAWILAAFVMIAPGQAWARATVIDDFSDIAPWQAIPSSGVTMNLSKVPGRTGDALKIDFDFTRGSGYAAVRRNVNLPLPANYRLRYAVHGPAPANNTLEFKLVDPSGDNVWWVNQRNFEFPADWKDVVHRKRNIAFAWGPSSAPLAQVGAIEIVITAGVGGGGKGSIVIDDLSIEPLPETTVASKPIKVTTNSIAADAALLPELPADGSLRWKSNPADATATLELDFQGVREIGGLIMYWAAEYASEYDIDVKQADGSWLTAYRYRAGDGGRDDAPLPGVETTAARIRVLKPAKEGAGVGLDVLQVAPAEYSEDPNQLIKSLAVSYPHGSWPKYAYGKQTFWAVVGAPGDRDEALMNEEAMVEVAKGAYSIEPSIQVNRRVIPWSDVNTVQWLDARHLPIPTSRWEIEGFQLSVTPFVAGEPGKSTLYIRYSLTNRTAFTVQGLMNLAIRPLQVYPPTQQLNITGGFSPIRSIARTERGVRVNGERELFLLSEPTAFGATTLASGDISEWRIRRQLPPHTEAADPTGFASGMLSFPIDLKRGETIEYWVASPMVAGSTPADMASTPEQARELLAKVTSDWKQRLDRVTISASSKGADYVDALKASLGYILVNRDGPSIQPGSRAYERSWIRDGSLTSMALLQFGFHEEVKEFLDWFGPYQYDDGKVPCCVDSRGPDPVPEHDSHGQYIFAVRQYYDYTQDADLVRRHWPRIVKAVDYIESLRKQRMTDEYATGPADKRAMLGLVPESISHEGYSAKPMHSYWDNYFILRGLRDAADLASIVGDSAQQGRMSSLADSFALSLHASVELAMKNKGIDYVPGCVELGDFDATSTAIALYPANVDDALPRIAIERTFERAWEAFAARRSGAKAWRDYTPYEMRLVSAMLMLDQPQRAREMLAWYMNDRTPKGWQQWGEIVWREKTKGNFIGDLPHTWVASDYIKAFGNMFAYKRAHDQALVLAAGIPADWIQSGTGISVQGLWTPAGQLSYSFKGNQQRWEAHIDSLDRTPPGGVILAFPDDRVPTSVTVNGQPATPSGREVALPSLPATVEFTFEAPAE